MAIGAGEGGGGDHGKTKQAHMMNSYEWRILSQIVSYCGEIYTAKQHSSQHNVVLVAVD